jgi:glycosyltransferase involved in cell wall biosynthesis
MKIAFVTTQTLAGSTNIGRILPLARELARRHEVHLLAHKGRRATPRGVRVHITGQDPFIRTAQGKRRLSGARLLLRLKLNTLRAAFTLIKLKPQAIVISKSLPESVFAAWLASTLLRRTRIILDVDDFELTANQLSSLNQRAAIHAAERIGARSAHAIAAASPFLQDHFRQLTQERKKISLIATGVTSPSPVLQALPEARSGELLYLGSISLSSGHRVDLLPPILAKIREQFPEATLTIAGSGDDTERLREDFAALGLATAVTWPGRFTPSEVAGLINRAAILIDPIDASITNRAKSSFRTAIAAAYGRAIVTSDVGIRPYQSLHARFFAFPGDVNDYAQKINGLLKVPLRENEQRQLTEHARGYQWGTLAQKYARLLPL